MNSLIQKYVDMQKAFYCQGLQGVPVEVCRAVVGPEESFNIDVPWLYNAMFHNVDHSNHVALDFGCGVGRLIGWFSDRFKHIDGVDLSDAMIRYAHEYLAQLNVTNYALYQNVDGYNIKEIASDVYDMVYSAWIFEHICVHKLRMMLFQEFYRVLKSGGSMSILMQGGDRYLCNSTCFKWYDDYYAAPSTNHTHDVKIDNFFDVTRDLSSLGFYNVSFVVVPIPEELQYAPPKYAGHQFSIIIKATKP